MNGLFCVYEKLRGMGIFKGAKLLKQFTVKICSIQVW